jgi:hypothetical protein
MKKILITLYAVFALAPLVAYGVTPSDIGNQACNAAPGSVGCGSRSILGAGGIFSSLINDVIYVAASISVLMIVIGGLRYTLSGGDAAGTRGAKDTIIYAVVGLVISMTAFALVNFVIGRF